MRYVAQPGDSPLNIARRFGVARDALLRANPHKPLTKVAGQVTWRELSPGEAIAVPVGVGMVGLSPTDTYVVQSGDTGEKVALKLVGDKSRWRELLVTNPHLKSAQYGISLYTGKTIKLPPSWVESAAAPAPVAPPISIPVPVAPPPSPVVVAPPPAPSMSGSKYTVKAGDTGEKIALAFTGSKGRWIELVAVNPTLKDPKYGIKLFAGKVINLPASWGAASAQPPPVSVPAPVLPAPPIGPPQTVVVTPVAPKAPVVHPAILALLAINPCDRANADIVCQAQAALGFVPGAGVDGKYGSTTASAAQKVLPNAPAGCSPRPSWWAPAGSSNCSGAKPPLPTPPPSALPPIVAPPVAPPVVAPPVVAPPVVVAPPPPPPVAPPPVAPPVAPPSDVGPAPAPGPGPIQPVVTAPEEKKGLSTGAIVAGGLGVLALGGLIALAASGGKKSSTSKTTITRPARRRSAKKPARKTKRKASKKKSKSKRRR